MAFVAVHLATVAFVSLVSGDDLHVRRFTNDAVPRSCRQVDDVLDKAWRSLAADLLVIGEGEVYRHAELGRGKGRDLGQHDGEERLHVAGPATEQPAVLLDQLERIRRP